MKIRKLGHCCMVISVRGKTILTDPGSYTVESHSALTGIDYVLFTHEHQDHYHLESLKDVLRSNPQAMVYANGSVSALLAQEGIDHVLVKNGETVMLGEVAVTGIGEKHALMHSSIPPADNMGYMIDERLWYPGDAFTDPGRPVKVLALPVSGPWMKLSEAIDYALSLRPEVAFPVHDGTRFGIAHVLAERVLAEAGLKFVPMVEGDEREF